MRGVVTAEVASDIQFEGCTSILGSTSAASARKSFQLRWPTRSSRWQLDLQANWLPWNDIMPEVEMFC